MDESVAEGAPVPDGKFRIDVEGRGVRRALARVALPAIEQLVGLRELERVYRRVAVGPPGAELARRTLADLEIDVAIPAEDLARVPATGPAIVVANHPYGAIEGLVLASVLAERRPDARTMANFLLGRIPELREMFLLVDPFERRGSARGNFSAMRRALEWLREGHILGVFPAGEVAAYDLRLRQVAERPWNPAIARLARRAACPVVPVYFSGSNGPLFHLAGLLHPALRTALLPREMLNKRGARLEVRVGSAIPSSRLAQFEDDRDAIAYLRDRTYVQASRVVADGAAVQPRVTPARTAPIVPPVDPVAIAGEIEALPAEACLARGDGLEVWVAAAPEIPQTLREIGRLREVSFRAVGEGTGRELDLDRFDPHYLHLFAWNRASRELVGAYRLGCTDVLLERFGRDGLYTSTLFGYRSRLFEAMGPALEMGRSFIRPEYQRSFSGLMLLWKGIGQYVVRHPRYATLFGPVSISAEYRHESQRLIVAFLRQNHYVHEWSRWVRPRTPFEPETRGEGRLRPAHLKNLDDVSSFIAEIEADQKGVPILLRQYLKLGGRLLGFNVDPEFSSVLDVLLLVDLRLTERRILARYMGAEQADGFLAHHRGAPLGSRVG